MSEEEKQELALDETTNTDDDGTIDDSTLEETTDESTPEESNSEETAEQKASREAHFQKLHTEKERELKETMERLNALDASGRLTRIARGEEPVRPTAEERETLVGDMTVAELNQVIARGVSGPVSAATQRAEQITQYKNNLDGAVATLNKFNKAHDIPEKESTALMEELRADYGITLRHEQDASGAYGSHTPAQLVKLYVREQSARGRTKTSTKKADAAKAAAAGKVEAAKKVAQPTGGSLGDPKKMTKNEKYLQSLRDAGANKANEEFFGSD